MAYFEVNLDYESSERAGAGGMFQVISIQMTMKTTLRILPIKGNTIQV
jgi:hypothetical protein